MRAIFADDGEQAQANIINAIFAVEHGGNRQSRIDTAEQTFAEVADGHRYGVEGCTLALNNATAGFTNVVFNIVLIEFGIFDIALRCFAVVLNRYVGDVCDGPRYESGVAVFTENVCVNIFLVNGIIFSNTSSQACGIEDRTGTDNAFFGKAGVFAESVSKDVNGITYDDVGSIGSVFYDFRCYGLQDVDVDLRKVKSGLTGLSRNAGSNDDDIGVFGVRIGAGINGCGITEGNTLSDIKRFAESLLLVDIDHNDFGSETHDREGVRNGGAYATGTDYCDFIHKEPLSKVEFLLYLLIISEPRSHR